MDDFKDIPFGVERNHLLQQKWNELTDDVKRDYNTRARANASGHGEGSNSKAMVKSCLNRLKKEVCKILYCLDV